MRSFCGDLAGLIRAVEFRDIEAGLTCIAAFGSDAWDRLFGNPRPAELHPFREFRSGGRHAVATPGDVLFHIRAQRMDICFELATQIMERLGDAVSPADEVQGFRYFEDRDLIGFVDGTENPEARLPSNPRWLAGGRSFCWRQLCHHPKISSRYESMECSVHGGAGAHYRPQEASDIEMDDAVKPSNAHSALTVVEENGKEVKILRDNMPFGQPGRG